MTDNRNPANHVHAAANEQVCLRLPVGLATALRVRAAKERRSLSAVATMALQQHLPEYLEDSQKHRRPKKTEAKEAPPRAA
jgi:plasmid stability protein